jgi:apolipoprotein N-acyltransferase
MNNQPPTPIESALAGRGEGENTVRSEPALTQPGSPRLREVSLSSSDGGTGAAPSSGISEPPKREMEIGDGRDACPTPPPHRPLPALLMAVGAVLSFHVAYLTSWGLVAMLLFFCFLVALTRLDTARRAFNYGVGIGLLCYTPHLAWMWNIFGPPAMALWMVLPIWLGVFLMLAAFVRRQLPVWAALLLMPTLWLGIEYFRSEIYLLKFSWLNIGYALHAEFNQAGMYAAGFACCLLGAAVAFVWRRWWKPGFGSAVAILLVAVVVLPIFLRASRTKPPVLLVAGIQLEFPNEGAVLSALNQVARKYPNAPLIVLPEYTFDGPIPERVRDWCREQGKWLVAGGKAPLGTTNFYNTAFVVSTNGEIVFQQVKSVPIQFFRDGLPAPEQRVWESPWGKLGICICYDLSYTRVTDELIRQGAQMILCPTMDVESWGRYQHELHSRVAPVRAAEYDVPIFRVASSGISQDVTRRGGVRRTAPFPGQGEIIVGPLAPMGPAGRLPLDRMAAPLAVVVTLLTALFALATRLRRRFAPLAPNQPTHPKP